MPSSPDHGAAPVRAWQPMPLEDVTSSALGSPPGSAAELPRTAETALATCVFEAEPVLVPAREAFAVSPTIGVPGDVLESARSAARAAGYADGWATGMREAKAATEERLAAERRAADEARALALARQTRAIDALASAAAQVDARQAIAAHDIEDEIITAAFAIAEALVGTVLADDAQRAPAALARALSLTPDDADVTVNVSLADFAVLASTVDEPTDGRDLRTHDGRHTITVRADPTVTDGDATAHCGATDIDARLSAAIDRVRQVLTP